MERSQIAETIDRELSGAKTIPNREQNIKCLCGSTDYFCVWTSKHIDARILECCSCGLKRTYPVPDSGPSAQVYQDTETIYPIKSYIENKDLWRSFASKIMCEVYKRKTTGNLLDIGCFMGILLEMAREQGWSTYGVEINQSACAYAQSQLGLDVFQGELIDAKFPNNFFDTIVCNHVLEHISEPIKFLTEIKRILRSDGLLIVGVQNIDSWIAKYYGYRWYALRPDQHVWQFSPKTLKATFEKNGFQVKALTVDLLWYEYPSNLKGLVKQSLFQLIKAMGRGDAILATLVSKDHQVEDGASEIHTM